TGVLGGFTNFSSFSLDAALLWERGAIAAAASYVVASVVLSLAAVFAGLALMRSLS
ncbi:MAG: CrcB family protein, partial [Beijerinckiaceae bacterium]